MLKDEGEMRNLPRRHDGYGGVGGSRCAVCGPRSLDLGPGVPISRLRSPVSVIAALLVATGWILAQPAQTQGPVFKYYVWGQVRSPGAYSLGASPDLMELLSAAGGPTQNADVRHVVLIRATTQQRVRINLKTMMFSGQIVSISPGDIVLVPNSPWYSVTLYFSMTATLVSFATLIFTVMNWMGTR